MNILLDTSVLIAAMVETHPIHKDISNTRQ
jgi:predicted nucleic acid-binding protein